MEWVFEKAYAADGIVMPPDKNAFAIWNGHDKGGMTLPLLWMYVKFLWNFGLGNVKRISALDKKVKNRYLKDIDFIYLWLLGVAPDHQGEGLSSKLLNPKLAEADRLKLPVYLETTNPQNNPIYEHKGFEV